MNWTNGLVAMTAIIEVSLIAALFANFVFYSFGIWGLVVVLVVWAVVGVFAFSLETMGDK